MAAWDSVSCDEWISTALDFHAINYFIKRLSFSGTDICCALSHCGIRKATISASLLVTDSDWLISALNIGTLRIHFSCLTLPKWLHYGRIFLAGAKTNWRSQYFQSISYISGQCLPDTNWETDVSKWVSLFSCLLCLSVSINEECFCVS